MIIESQEGSLKVDTETKGAKGRTETKHFPLLKKVANFLKNLLTFL